MPVIMLTARDSVVDKVSGLDSGADDYITKPFAIEELLARIRAALRKRGSGERPEEPLLSAGPLTMDVERHTVAVSGTPVELTRREFDLLRYLLENKGRVLSREALLDSVWGFDFVGETNSVDVYIRFLRGKLDDAFGIKLIHTVPGRGLRHPGGVRPGRRGADSYDDRLYLQDRFYPGVRPDAGPGRRAAGLCPARGYGKGGARGDILYLGWLMAGHISGIDHAVKRFHVRAACGVGMTPPGTRCCRTWPGQLCAKRPHLLPSGRLDPEKSGVAPAPDGRDGHQGLRQSLQQKRERTPQEQRQLDLLLRGGSCVAFRNLTPLLGG